MTSHFKRLSSLFGASLPMLFFQSVKVPSSHSLFLYLFELSVCIGSNLLKSGSCLFLALKAFLWVKLLFQSCPAASIRIPAFEWFYLFRNLESCLQIRFFVWFCTALSIQFHFLYLWFHHRGEWQFLRFLRKYLEIYFRYLLIYLNWNLFRLFLYLKFEFLKLH